MPGQVPGVGRGPVFQPVVAPPFSPPLQPGEAGGASGSDITNALYQAYTGTHTGTSTPVQSPHVSSWVAYWDTPVSGASLPAASFYVTVRGVSDDGTNVDLQVQTASDPWFTTGVATFTSLNLVSNAPTQILVGPLTYDQVSYLRVRAGNFASGAWSAYTVTTVVTVTTQRSADVVYIWTNVGVNLTLSRNDTQYIWTNIGVSLIPTGWDVSWIREGDVDTSSPEPWLWTIRPDTGRPGDGITLYGHGFGATQGTYSGQVEMLINDVWIPVSVTSWTLVAATANAYLAGRSIVPSTPVVDPEHIEIQATIPASAVPIGHIARVRTVT